MKNYEIPAQSGAQVDVDIQVTNGTWSFEHGVADSFVSHVRKSVPLYDHGHRMAAEIASCFTLPGGFAYELGCSTGELITKLANYNSRTKSVNWVGIDNSIEMVEKARESCKQFDNIEIILGDIVDYELQTCDYVVDFLTSQFLKKTTQLTLFSKIYNSLKERGAFFLYTKILQEDSFFQDLSSVMYNRFKISNGLSPSHVLSKSESVYGVIKPEPQHVMLNLLHEAGFQKILPIIRFLNFEGYLAVRV